MKEKNLEEERFFWRTTNPYVKKIEAKLLAQAFKGVNGGKILEVGCGTGANFFFLKKYFSDLTGLDPAEESLAVGRREIGEAKFIKGQAQVIPFLAGTFDLVFMRDVLHHINEENAKKLALKEMRRVCRQNGRIVIIEPNHKNIIIFLQSLIRKEEKGLKYSTLELIKKWLAEEDYHKVLFDYAEPLPLDRLILHYRSGWPWLSHLFIIRFLFTIFNSLYKILIPKRLWAYLIFKAEK